MNVQISRLYDIARKNERNIIGLMSGTSLDGLDIALCKISGNGSKTKLYLSHFETFDYNEDFRQLIKKVFAKKQVDQQLLCGINPHIAKMHAHLILQALAKWRLKPDDVDIIASHGQTVYHAPQSYTNNQGLPNSTLQIGDGDHIASDTGIITISDFRQKHIAKGGEGAPIAAYGDYLLFSSSEESRILLNIGGIANLTFLPRSGLTQQAYATDIGPGNTLMNQYVFDHFGIEMDKDAEIAKKGVVHKEFLERLLSTPFLKDVFPKTTGPELFNLEYLEDAKSSFHLSHEDIMATLCSFSAETIINGIRRATKDIDSYSVYVSGGGLHNPLLMQMIKNGLQDINVQSFETIGFNPDAKEACLFALLANETLVGSPENVAYIKNSPAVCMGKISFPY